jgi:hypothetical protein
MQDLVDLFSHLRTLLVFVSGYALQAFYFSHQIVEAFSEVAGGLHVQLSLTIVITRTSAGCMLS